MTIRKEKENKIRTKNNDPDIYEIYDNMQALNKLSDEEIYEYIDSGEVFDKAGSYGIQGKGGLLVKGIEGDYFNVVGLPVARLKRELLEFLP